MKGKAGATEGTKGSTQRRQRPLDITVLMGGPSSEREVSIMSGTAIADALERAGHTVTRSDIAPDEFSALERDEADLFFIALHGDFGESGDVQRLCEARGRRYTGSGPEASQLALDKAAAKQFFRRANLPTPDWMIIEEYHSPGDVRKWLEELPPPVVLKPVDGGSSVDITIARDAARRDAALEDLIDKYGRAMLEAFVDGRELTVGILGEVALPMLEVVPAREFYDFEAKYSDDAGTQYTFDHGLSAETCQGVQSDALQAHKVLGCRDMSRVDFLLDADGVAQVLEINTIPGFTSHSLLPMAAAKVGISFEQLVDRIANMAISR
jgi:D-alanine-D-alanine ligase